ncbi:MAG TPA: beta-ketoacyl-ACP reductase [Spirochaetia bacterium]|nr:beta-ketoacyl-ACP reductase [Spirochaetia bacterium]
MNRFAHKIVLVTGGSKGIGKKICLDFAKEGAIVFFFYKSDSLAANETIEELQKYHNASQAYQCSTTNEQDVQNNIRNIIKNMGKIDILVNNAGITRDSLFFLAKLQDWSDVIETNLSGVFLMTKEVSRYMIKQKSGRIINIASTSAIKANVGQTSYAASKAGIIAYTRAVALELIPYNIFVNSVSPGFITTELIKTIPEKMMENIKSAIPLKKIGSPSEVSNSVLFLASEQAGYIVGHNLVIDGGLTL